VAASLALEDGVPIIHRAGAEGNIRCLFSTLPDTASHGNAAVRSRYAHASGRVARPEAVLPGQRMRTPVRDAFAQIDGAEKIEFGAPTHDSQGALPAVRVARVSLLGVASYGAHFRARRAEAWG